VLPIQDGAVHGCVELNVVSNLPVRPLLLQSAPLPKLEMFVLHVTAPGRQEQPLQPPALIPDMIVNWSV